MWWFELTSTTVYEPGEGHIAHPFYFQIIHLLMAIKIDNLMGGKGYTGVTWFNLKISFIVLRIFL